MKKKEDVRKSLDYLDLMVTSQEKLVILRDR